MNMPRSIVVELLVILLCVWKSDTQKVCIEPVKGDLDIAALFWSNNAFQQASDPFKFNLCMGDKHQCKIELNNGTVIANNYNGVSTTDFSETLLTFNMGTGTNSVFLYFTCDPNTLGKPVLLDNQGGKYYFEWKSHIACKGSVATQNAAKPQMPCYIYNGDDLIDLTDMTNTTSYKVQKDSANYTLNICRNVTDVSGCDAAVCEGDNAVAIVTEETVLESAANGDVFVKYAKPDGKDCGTKITFKCPDSPYHATGPVFVSPSDGCDHVIDWYTMDACPSEDLFSSNCTLQNSKYLIDIDLTPLNNNGKVYLASGAEFDYSIAMCGASVQDCSLTNDDGTRGHTVACQKKSLESAFHKNLGMSKFTKLRFVDDALVMTMSKGDVCSSGFQRRTIIHFHCNVTEGEGNPEYVGETDCTYMFVWHTRYACNRIQKCSFTNTTDPSKVYDFSSLTVAQDATSWTVKLGEKKMAYINICAAVGHVADCDPSAAVCVKETGQSANPSAVENHGQASTMKFSSEGNTISITYDHGSVCNTKETHHSVIYFACASADQSVGPQLRTESSSNACRHTYTWFTPAACAQSTEGHGDCTITDAGYTYDFNSLTADLTAKTSDNTQYKFNPCSTLQDGCETKSRFCEGNTLISKEIPELAVENDHVVTAKFNPESGNPSATVRYICDHTAEEPKVITSDNSITVEVNTTLACAPKTVDCKPIDSLGNAYDFSGLKGTNWKASSVDGMSYYFSICSTLDKDLSDVKGCPGGAISACQRTSDGTLVNLGYAASNPVIQSTGTVLFHYINGKKCAHGNQTPRQTMITLSCAQVESQPQMISEDLNCNYNILWHTPKACPVQSSSATGEDCSIVKNEIKYDLTPLKSKPLQTVFKGTTYNVGICSMAKVQGNPPNCANSAVCASSGSTSNSFGELKKESLYSEEGGIKLKYETDGNSKTSIITFTCNAENDQTELRFLSNDGVVVRFQVSTRYVCPPVESANCRRTFGDDTFDLSSLTLHGANYISRLRSTPGDIYYYTNICHRLIATTEAAGCPAGSAACMYNSSSKQYTSLGKLTSNKPDFIHKMGSFLYLQYDNGDKCPTNRSALLQTLILLRCVEGPRTSRIEVGTAIKDCRQDFILESPAACPVKSPVNAKCGEIAGFDTNALKKQYRISSEEHDYILNFCQNSGSLDSDVKKCNNQAMFGVCQISKSSGHEEVIAGGPQLTAMKETSQLIFNFTGGATCAHATGNVERNVVLTMFCNEYAQSDSQPQFVSEDPRDCTYYISWPRRDLCPHRSMPCRVTMNGELFDLSSLNRADKDYFTYATVSSSVDEKYQGKYYQLSVCSAAPSKNFKCAGAAVCEVTEKDSEHVIHKSLGYPDDSPTVTGDPQHIEIVYPTQTYCDDKKSKIRSVIKFTCGSGMNDPELVSSDGCTYEFKWETSLVCPSTSKPTPTSGCVFTKPSINKIVDLSIFTNKLYKAGDYSLKVCSSLSESELSGCLAGTAVCKGGVSFGSAAEYKIYEEFGNIRLEYDNGESCREDDNSSGNRKSIIEFRCNKTAGEGQPIYLPTSPRCVDRFSWETSYICVEDCELNYKGNVFNFQHLSSVYKPVTVTADGYEFTMDLCKSLKAEHKCGNYTNICAKSSDGTIYPIALTNTFEPQYQPENKTVLLKYSYSDEKSPANNKQVNIRLVCNGTLDTGSPTFVSKTGSTYNFKWVTYVACLDKDLHEVPLGFNLFKTLLQSTNPPFSRSVVITGDQTEYKYYISLGAPLHDIPELSQECLDGNTTVCQYKHENTFERSIGAQAAKYYANEKQLQMIISSKSKCGRVGSDTVTSLINFKCDSSASEDSLPVNTNEMASCRYLFEWNLPQLCEPLSSAAGGTQSKGLSPGVTAVIVIIVLASVISLATVIVCRLKRRRRYNGPVGYDPLSTDDDTTGLITAVKGRAPRLYHDDDDDDLLI